MSLDDYDRWGENLGDCDVCGVLEAEYKEMVEVGETGDMKQMELCTDCHEKAMDYRHGLDVDWSDEKRL